MLKYHSLELDGIPGEGIIAISGENESGKSSIGETICFALFGRTFSLDHDQIQKILRWGASRCSVNLEFSVDGTRYVVERFLDREGNHGARLSLAGRSEENLARGVGPVADRLQELLGYEFDEFVDSFYLAQREITSPHPHSVAVKNMAGVAPLEKVAGQFREEIAKFDEMLADVDAEVEALRQEKDELNFQEGLLIQLEDRKNAVESEVRANRERINGLREAFENYEKNYPLIRKAEGKRGRGRFWRFLFFLLAVVLGGAWGLFTQGGGQPLAQQLHQFLQQRIPGWQDAWIPYLGVGGAFSAALMLLMWLRVASHNKRVKSLVESSSSLVEALEQARAVTPLDPSLEEEEDDFRTEPPKRPEEAAYARLLPLIESAKAAPDTVDGLVSAELEWLEHEVARKEVALGRLSQQVDEEMERVRQMARLTEVIEGLERKEADLNQAKEKRRRAIELIDGAAAEFSHEFNGKIREMMAHTLPVFTQGHYEHLRIDPDLTVRIFSSDKRDFLDLDEVSSGTQRQIMLALRLALSQKLLNRRVKGPQFAFLDEPFAFFDEERTRFALKTLSSLSERLTQIWIVAQSYPQGADVAFAMSIQCSRDKDFLKEGAATDSRPREEVAETVEAGEKEQDSEEE